MTPSPAPTDQNPRRGAGRLMMVRIPGTRLGEDTARFLRAHHIRAVCLFRQNMVDAAQLTRLTADLRAALGPRALIALDQEGGAVVRAGWLPAPPSAMALGAAGDAAVARAVGAAVARGVRALGFNWNFAPVLDLNNNPDNPVIAERSFGADPARAGALALAWMDGSLAEGVACCVKHAPGHGDTHLDSHRALPRVDKPRAALEALEFAPFRQAAPRAPAMMTAHIVYPALDPVHPATLSPAILTGLVRDDWRFDGVIITDGMDMHAIAHHYGVGKAALGAVLAGADMVMALGERAAQQATFDALAAAIESGQIDPARLERSLARLDGLAARYPCGQPPYATEDADRALMARAWRAGLTAYRQPRRPAPGQALRLVVRADVVSDGVSEAGLSARHLTQWLTREYGAGVGAVEVDTVTFDDPERFDWAGLPDDGRFTILASTARRRYGARARASFAPDLHLALWNPFPALDIAAPALLTYGFADAALAAVGDWLRGAARAGGRCPVAGFGDGDGDGAPLLA